ncbi:MAG: LysR family transcriptional regulator [Comamonadaceae bacterium]|nr:LysR family transcriptional regulator [Comamonadaceae bacterium]
MSLRELRSLVAVADNGSITAAAEVVFLSVPAISAHITNLEAAYRLQLMDRTRKPARLNEAGRALALRAREVLQLHDQLHEAVAEPTDLSGLLTLGASVTVLTNVIPQALLALRTRHPKLLMRMQYDRPWNLLEQLAHGEIDAAVLSEPRGYVADVTWTKFAREPIVVIAPPHARGRTDEALLNEFPYIRYSRQFWVSREIEAHLAQRRIALRESMEVDSREAIELMVRHGLGVSIIPQSDPTIARFYGLRAVPLGKPALMRELGLARRNSSPKQRLIAALFDTLKATSRHARSSKSAEALKQP